MLDLTTHLDDDDDEDEDDDDDQDHTAKEEGSLVDCLDNLRFLRWLIIRLLAYLFVDDVT